MRGRPRPQRNCWRTPGSLPKNISTHRLALLDTLLHIPMSEVLSALPLSPSIVMALEANEGILGQLLAATVAANEGKAQTAAELLANAGIAPEKHLNAQVSAYGWASRITLE
jgi:c-di-GMP-related signal transduction protein